MVKVLKSAALTAVLAAMAMVTATSARAAGALVVGTATPQDGGGYGWSADYPNEGEAKYLALVNCLEPRTDVTAQARAACRLLTVFNKQCLGFSWDPPAYQGNWAVGTEKKTAETDAISKCNAMLGGSGKCVLVASACDTVGSGAPAVASVPSATAPMSMAISRPVQVQSGGGPLKR